MILSFRSAGRLRQADDMRLFTWQTATGFGGESGQQAAVDAIHFDFVLHAEALKSLSRIEQISDNPKETGINTPCKLMKSNASQLRLSHKLQD